MPLKDEINEITDAIFDEPRQRIKNEFYAKPFQAKPISPFRHIMNIIGILQLLIALAFTPLTLVFNDNTVFQVDWSLRVTGDYGTGSMTVIQALETASGVSLAELSPYGWLLTPVNMLVIIVGLNLVAYILSALLRWLPLKRLRHTAKMINLASLVVMFLIAYSYYGVLKAYGVFSSMKVNEIAWGPTILGSFGLLFLLTGNSSGALG